jgi:hypothetical protein
MSIADNLRTLIGEIDAHLAVLKKITDFYDEHSAKADGQEQSVENAIILSDILKTALTVQSGIRTCLKK